VSSSQPGDFKPGDKVIVIIGNTKFDNTVGRTGTVCSVSDAGDMICVRDLTPKIKGAPRERTFFRDQLSKR
jgi:ribosomal protein L24